MYSTRWHVVASYALLVSTCTLLIDMFWDLVASHNPNIILLTCVGTWSGLRHRNHIPECPEHAYILIPHSANNSASIQGKFSLVGSGTWVGDLVGSQLTSTPTSTLPYKTFVMTGVTSVTRPSLFIARISLCAAAH